LSDTHVASARGGSIRAGKRARGRLGSTERDVVEKCPRRETVQFVWAAEGSPASKANNAKYIPRHQRT